MGRSSLTYYQYYFDKEGYTEVLNPYMETFYETYPITLSIILTFIAVGLARELLLDIFDKKEYNKKTGGK